MKPKTARRMWLSVALILFGTIQSALANEKAFNCEEQHVVGLSNIEGNWSPAYSNGTTIKQYTIRFNDSMTEMFGVQNGKTIYRCRKNFPTKAPDLLTCTNPLVGTIVFNFSTSSEKFLASFVSPGGWLTDPTTIEPGDTLLVDHLIMGQCQRF